MYVLVKFVSVMTKKWLGFPLNKIFGDSHEINALVGLKYSKKFKKIDFRIDLVESKS